MNLIVVKFAASGIYRAYFEGTPNFYGEGMSREDAIRALVLKTYKILEVYIDLMKDK